MALGERAWHIDSVWQAAQDLPVEEVPVESIRELDEDCWFDGRPATVRAIVDHVKGINDADLALPVILAADGRCLAGCTG